MTSRTSRRWPRPIVAALALALALAVGTGAGLAAWPASATPRAVPTATLAADTGRTLVPLKLPTGQAAKPVVIRPVVSGTCAAVRAHLRQYAARHIVTVSCVTVTPEAAPAPARTGEQLAVPMAAVNPLCASTSGAWVINRTNECIQNFGVVYLVIDEGTVLGTAYFSVNQSIATSTNSNTITENDTITETSATAEANTEGTMQFTPQCGSACAVLNGTSTFSIGPGQSKTLQISYRDSPATGNQDKFTTSYIAPFSVPGAPSINSAQWSSPGTIRCDNQLAGRSVGCVFPAYVPPLVLSVATYGAAALNALIGEHDLAGTPGLSAATPLTRGDPTQTPGNSDAICDKTFYPAPWLIPTDSCDEYPFASSQQSGAQLNLTGEDCMEIVPVNINGTWSVYFLNRDVLPQRCLRGHVPLAQNTSVGGPLSSLYTLNRMLLGDPYTVVVTY
jgi:hypothetical protein